MRNSVISVLATLCAGSAFVSTGASGQQPTAMSLMMAMMACPALAADGETIAIFSLDPAGSEDARNSLAIFDANGVLQRRLPIVPPAVDETKAAKSAGEIAALFGSGGYRRMGRMARGNSAQATRREHAGDPPPTYQTLLTSADSTFDFRVIDRQVTVQAARSQTKLGTFTRTLSATDGPCKSVVGTSIANTRAGFDPRTNLLAFSVDMEDAGGQVCFSHDFVVTILGPVTRP